VGSARVGWHAGTWLEVWGACGVWRVWATPGRGDQRWARPDHGGYLNHGGCLTVVGVFSCVGVGVGVGVVVSMAVRVDG
jgi:hypothetical protein